MAEIPEDTAPLEQMGREDGDAASATGAPTGPPLLYREAAHSKRVSPSQMAATCHPSTQGHLPRAEQPAEGGQVHVSPKSNSPHTKRVQVLAQTSSSFEEIPNPSQHRLKVPVEFSAKSRLKAESCSTPAPPSSAAPGHPCPDPSLRNSFCSNFVLKGVGGAESNVGTE